MPFTLAQAGYVVVAADYAGLGVQTSWDGSHVSAQYQNRQAQAFDSLYALRAAREIFADKITNEYVNVGHSQGGAAAWGVSEVLAEKFNNKFDDLEHHYLGSVIFAPGINALYSAPQAFGQWICKDLHLMYPDFKLSDWLSPLEIDRTELLTQIQGGQYVVPAVGRSAERILRARCWWILDLSHCIMGELDQAMPFNVVD